MTLRDAILTSAMVLLVGGPALCQVAPPPPNPTSPPVPPAPPRPTDPPEPGRAPLGAPIQVQVAQPAIPPGTPSTPPVAAPMGLPSSATKAKKVSEMGLDELLQ